MGTNSSGSNPKGAANKSGKSSSKGFSPPSGKFHPPAAGAHAPKDVHTISGGHGKGGAGGVHPSLKKPGLMS